MVSHNGVILTHEINTQNKVKCDVCFGEYVNDNVVARFEEGAATNGFDRALDDVIRGRQFGIVDIKLFTQK